MHFPFTYSQSETLRSLHASGHVGKRKGAKRPQRYEAKANVRSELWRMRWMGHSELLDGRGQLEQGYAEHKSACGSMASVPAGIRQEKTG